jgi:hypothetical protein
VRRGNRKAGSMKSSVATADREMFAQFNVVIVLPMRLTFSRRYFPTLKPGKCF